MTRNRRTVAVLLAALALLAGGAVAQDKEKNIVAGQAEVKKLLLLMDKDTNGKISHQEFMNFMEAEFVSLDVNKDGELDVKELSKTRMRFVGAAHPSR